LNSENESLKPKRVIIEAKIEAKYPITGRFVVHISKNLIKNNFLKPDQEYLQKFLNIVAESIDEIIDYMEDEDDDYNQTQH
jgi:hypothetical protein